MTADRACLAVLALALALICTPAWAAPSEPTQSDWAVGPIAGLFLAEEANGGRPLRVGAGPRVIYSGLGGVELHADYVLSGYDTGSGPAVVSTWHHRASLALSPTALLGSFRLSFSIGPALSVMATDLGHGTPDVQSITVIRPGLLGAVALGIKRPGLDARLELSSVTRAGRADVIVGLVVPVPL